jgi:hypothetical protein
LAGDRCIPGDLGRTRSRGFEKSHHKFHNPDLL